MRMWPRRRSDAAARVAAAWAGLSPDVAARLLVDRSTRELASTASWLADEQAGREPVNLERLVAEPPFLSPWAEHQR